MRSCNFLELRGVVNLHNFLMLKRVYGAASMLKRRFAPVLPYEVPPSSKGPL